MIGYELINSISDSKYRQLLFSIWGNLPSNVHVEFYNLLSQTEKDNLMITINEDNITQEQWDSLSISDLKVIKK